MPKGVYKHKPRKKYAVPVVQEIANKIEAAQEQITCDLAKTMLCDIPEEVRLRKQVDELKHELLAVYRRLYLREY